MLIWFLDFIHFPPSANFVRNAFQFSGLRLNPLKFMATGTRAMDGLMVKQRLGVAAVGHCSGSQSKPQNW